MALLLKQMTSLLVFSDDYNVFHYKEVVLLSTVEVLMVALTIEILGCIKRCSYLPTHLQFFKYILAFLNCCGNREHSQHHIFQYCDQLLQTFVVG